MSETWLTAINVFIGLTSFGAILIGEIISDFVDDDLYEINFDRGKS